MHNQDGMPRTARCSGTSRRWTVAWPATLCLAYGIMLLCWGGANPPFASPDEWAHYIRALGAGDGDLIGPRCPFPGPAGDRRYVWMTQAARSFWVPDRLFATNLNANAGLSEKPFSWSDVVPLPGPRMAVTPVGNYQPLPYYLPGLLAHLGN